MANGSNFGAEYGEYSNDSMQSHKHGTHFHSQTIAPYFRPKKRFTVKRRAPSNGDDAKTNTRKISSQACKYVSITSPGCSGSMRRTRI